MSETILSEIVAKRKKTIELEREREGLYELIEKTRLLFPEGTKPLPFLGNHVKAESFLIAEIKKASPSRGIIREDFSVENISGAYGSSPYVKAVSVLTEPLYFQGDYRNLEIASDSMQGTGKRLPMLMKDFIFDEYQIVKGVLYGASAVLLIASVLEDRQAMELAKTASDYGLSVLFEVHSVEEYRRAADLGMKLIGINNRDLRNFVTDITTTADIIQAEGKPEGTVVISESGIHTHSDIDFLQRAGADGFLVGECFMKRDDISSAIKELMVGH